MSNMPPAGFTPNNTFDNAELSMNALDLWVKGLGNGLYFPLDLVVQGPFEISATYAIQQVRDEISEFAGEIVARGLRGTVVEIGLGYFGSTHFLWRTIFQNVVTIEMSVERCRAFVNNYSDFSGGHSCGDDGRSKFIFGSSHNPNVVRKAYEAAGGPVDMVFIDGDHSYAGVLCDWLLYHKMVRPGGIVAFHDVATPHDHVSEVPALVQKLEAGTLDGVRRPMKRIIRTPHTGIGFYVCS